jgi:hypothetical protein
MDSLHTYAAGLLLDSGLQTPRVRGTHAPREMASIYDYRESSGENVSQVQGLTLFRRRHTVFLRQLKRIRNPVHYRCMNQ